LERQRIGDGSPIGRPEGTPAGVPTPEVTELRLELVDGLDSLTGDWALLAKRSDNIFSTLDWTSIWWRHFGRDRPLLLGACRNGRGELVALLPLYLSSARPVRTVRFVGHGPADQLGPVCAPSDRRLAARALGLALAECCPPWDLFIGDLLPGDGNWSELLPATTLRREASPVISVEGRTWDEFLDSRSANFRGQVRGRERKLLREHVLRYRLATDPDRLEEDLRTLFQLHEANLGADFSDSHRGFHRDFAKRALARGWLRLWLMELDGRAVAAWYGFRYAGAEYYYQSAREQRWDRYSAGFVLLAHSMREAFNDGMREYRLLRGGEPYKQRFATGDPGLETVGLARTMRGRASILAATASRSMPRPARRLLTRLAG
jgi:CelD/BcsL family acetyltransferase involved in cellulose biosynthesis